MPEFEGLKLCFETLEICVIYILGIYYDVHVIERSVCTCSFKFLSVIGMNPLLVCINFALPFDFSSSSVIFCSVCFIGDFGKLRLIFTVFALRADFY